MERGDDVHAKGEYLSIEFSAASLLGSKDMIELPLDSNIDINADASGFGTLLVSALQGGHEGMVHLLLEKNDDR